MSENGEEKQPNGAISVQYLSFNNPYNTVPLDSFSNLPDKERNILSETGGKTCKQEMFTKNEKMPFDVSFILCNVHVIIHTHPQIHVM
jgi:hypothetical protein